MPNYCTIRQDLLDQGLRIRIGEGTKTIHDPYPYEYEWDGDEDFYIIINGKRFKAESIDFDFSKKYEAYYSVRVVIASSEKEAIEMVQEEIFEEEDELDLCDKVLTREELIKALTT
jgi:hypothetical protein